MGWHLYGRNRKFRTALAQALPAIDGIAQHYVPNGIYKLWGEELGWPAWIFDGSSLGLGKSLPDRINIADDLTILANFLDNLGPEALLASVTSSRRSHYSPQTLAWVRSAADAETMLKWQARCLELLNRYLVVDVSSKDQEIEIEISTPSNLGLLGEFVEHAIAMHLLQMTQLYSPVLSPGSRGLQPVTYFRGGEQSWHEVFAEMEHCEVHANSLVTRLSLPAALGRAENMNHDPVVWADALKHLDMMETSSSDSLSIDSLKSALHLIIERERRVPRLKELASAEGISERTLARRIASLGVTFQQIIDEVRAELAVKKLRDGSRPVNAIAEALGFSHSASFGRAFREWTGCSPSEWRARTAQTGSD